MNKNDIVFDVPEFSTAERLDMAYRAWKDWCIQLAKWGWPPRICQLRTMAEELLRAKGDRKELSVH
jgi:hypothetical protein